MALSNAVSQPEYRVRLFLSVDLVGSTAFKARYSEPDPSNASSHNPVWVDVIQHFYREFPDSFQQKYDLVAKSYEIKDPSIGTPLVWKTIGDEIVFCCRLNGEAHLSALLLAFVKTLAEYGSFLDKNHSQLDVKGNGWIAEFPAPNVTVEIYKNKLEPSAEAVSPIHSEEIERRADENPREFDFLGKSIDSGFRCGRLCSSDSFVLSIELAYLALKAAHSRVLEGVQFVYGGRQILKGVLNDKPYPIISLNVERNQNRADVRERERALLSNGHTPSILQFKEFIQSFIQDEGISAPVIRDKGKSKGDIDPPELYERYVVGWEASKKELYEREISEKRSAEEDTVKSSGRLPKEVLAPLEVSETISDQNDKETTKPQRKRRRRR